MSKPLPKELLEWIDKEYESHLDTAHNHPLHKCHYKIAMNRMAHHLIDNDSQLESASLPPQEAIEVERVDWDEVVDPETVLPPDIKLSPKELLQKYARLKSEKHGVAFEEGFSVCHKIFAKREQELVEALRAWLSHPDLVPKYYWEDAPLADIEAEHELSKRLLKNLGYGDSNG